MALHFSREELAERRARTVTAMQKAGLDGLLIFRQESMYYLTGYDTFGFVFFQCLYLGVDGRMVLLTRSADLRQAQQTSVIDDIRIWVDRDGASPATDLKAILAEMGCRGKRLGVEWEAYGLTARNGRRLSDALDFRLERLVRIGVDGDMNRLPYRQSPDIGLAKAGLDPDLVGIVQ